MLLAQAQLGVEVAYLESQAATDFRPNIESFVNEGCDLIITVGFLLAADTAQAACDYPDQKFAIIDQAPYPGAPWANDAGEYNCDYSKLRGLTFATDEAAFLAGYLAAGMTTSGVVGTFGGINIPPVTIFMDGFVKGVRYYNEINGTEVVALGWDPDTAEGLFTGNFESLDDGRAFGENLNDEGADIILPVAGPVGLGTAAAAAERGFLIIGVDADWYRHQPRHRRGDPDLDPEEHGCRRAQHHHQRVEPGLGRQPLRGHPRQRRRGPGPLPRPRGDRARRTGCCHRAVEGGHHRRGRPRCFPWPAAE